MKKLCRTDIKNESRKTFCCSPARLNQNQN